jgi:hypothetical protein
MKNNLKLLHIGLCATGFPFNGFQQPLFDRFKDYQEVYTGDPDLNPKLRGILLSGWVPDAIFIQIQRAEIIDYHIIAEFKKLGCFIINWSGDVREPLPEWFYLLAEHISVTCFSNETDVKIMRSKGYASEFLQIGYDPSIYYPSNNPRNGQIVFMANNSGNKFPLSQYRTDLIMQLKHRYGDRFELYGGGWGNVSNGSYNGNQKAEADKYRQVSFAINCSHFDYERYSSDRLLRILGCGVMCFSKYFPRCEEDFQDEYHLKFWETPEDLFKQIDHYTPKVAEPAIIGNHGNKLARENYTFEKMVLNIENIFNLYTNKI